MKIEIVVANSQNGVIGKNGKMPWNIPEDLKRFKEITENGSCLIMGRKTYEAIGNPLKNRYNFVITKKNIDIPGAFIFSDIDSALDFIMKKCLGEKIFVIGGASIYSQFLSMDIVNKIHQTLIKKDFDGDTFFDFDKENWKVVNQEDVILKSDKEKIKCSYLLWEKK